MQRRGDGEGGSANEGRPGAQGRGAVFCVSCLCVVLHLKKGGTGTTVGTGGEAGNNSAVPPTASALVFSCAASSACCVDAAERARTGAVERPPELLRPAAR